jgi:hypothetical protein
MLKQKVARGVARRARSRRATRGQSVRSEALRPRAHAATFRRLPRPIVRRQQRHRHAHAHDVRQKSSNYRAVTDLTVCLRATFCAANSGNAQRLRVASRGVCAAPTKLAAHPFSSLYRAACRTNLNAILVEPGTHCMRSSGVAYLRPSITQRRIHYAIDIKKRSGLLCCRDYSHGLFGCAPGRSQ